MIPNSAPTIIEVNSFQQTDETYATCGRINGKLVKLVIDSGAVRTIVHPRVFGKLNPDYPNIRIRTATGEVTPVLCELKCYIEIDEIRVLHDVLVANIEDDCLLSLNFLRQQKCVVDFGKAIMNIHGKEIPLSARSGPNSNRCTCFTKSDQIIAPNSEKLLRCVVPCKLPISAVTEPVPGNTETVLVARTYVDMSADEIVIRVANLSSGPVRIHCGTAIAVAENACVLEKSVHEAKPSKKLPEAIEDLLQRSECNLSSLEYQQLRNFLSRYCDVFCTGTDDTGRTNIVKHKIDVENCTPIRIPPRRLPLARRDEVQEMVNTMKEKGVIEESQSPWCSPIVLVKKKDGSTRFCVDYRRLNDVTKKDSYPLPRIDETLVSLSGSKWFSTLDLNSGYWQVVMDEQDKEKTAFSAGQNLYQFTVMPFGLCNAPATFERLMEFVLRGLTGSTCLVYLDDIIVLGTCFEDHIAKLTDVFERLRQAGLKLSCKKCQLFQKEAKYLGHIVSENGVETDPEKIKSIKEWPIPSNKKQLKSFLGLCAYYRRFIEGFSSIAKPLYSLTEDRADFVWDHLCQNAFGKLRLKLIEAPILAYPIAGGNFILDCDASDHGIGGVLSQIQNGQEKVIEYYSKTLSKSERNYCVTRRELLAAVKAVEHFSCYLYGRHFKIRSDHSALKWLLNFKNPEGQVARWIERLQPYDFEITHRAGRSHSNADALSRRPCSTDCTQCRKCESCDVKVVKTRTVEVEIQQDSDDEISLVKQWVEKGLRPAWEFVTPHNEAIKQFWSIFKTLSIENGYLIRKVTRANGTNHQIIVPQVKRAEILEEAHNSPSGGHFGFKKTLSKIQSRFYWPGYRMDVQIWCAKCIVCHERKGPNRRNRGPLKPINIGVPFEKVGMDILGPFPVTARGNKFVLVIMDYFTKWPEAIPIPDMTAETVAAVFVDRWVSNFGVPYEVHSDQGRNFESELMNRTLELVGTGKTRTTPLHPQSDGLVERYNQTLLDYLAKFIDSEQSNWDILLRLALMAYRSAEHESTGFSPSIMLFGREMILPLDMWRGSVSKSESAPEYVYQLKKTLNNIHKLAQDHLRVQIEKMKRNYDQRSIRTTFEDGDFVSLYTPVKRKGRCPKLQRDWVGPYKVIRQISDLVYQIQKHPRGKKVVVNIERLAKYPVTEAELDGTSAT